MRNKVEKFRVAATVVGTILILAACESGTPGPELTGRSESPFDLSKVVTAVEEGASGEVIPGVKVRYEGKAERADEDAFEGPFTVPGKVEPAKEDDPGGLENLDFTFYNVEEGTRFALEVDADLVQKMLEYDKKARADLGSERGGEDLEGKSDLELQHASDDRTVRSPTTSWPWRTIGQLSNGCSGTLVGPSVMVTAAHCVVSSGNYAFHGFTPARDGNNEPYGDANIVAITVPSTFVDEACSRDNWSWTCVRNDIAVVVLDDDYGFNMGYWYMSWGSLKHKAIYNRGYGNCGSHDAPPSCEWSRLYGKSGSGSFTGLSHRGANGWSDVATHDFYTNPGHSGSPTYMYVKGHAVVTGVHSSGTQNQRGGSAQRFGPSETGRISFMRNWAASR